MPYEIHAELKQPENLNGRIWRFMDLAKFIDLLDSSKLYFNRADCFEDPYEGLISDGYAEAVKSGRSNFGSLTDVHRACIERRVDYYVSSWHFAEHEPAGMWKLYAGSDGGIAIRSTYSRLQHAFDGTNERVFLGLVQYDDAQLYGSFNTFKLIMNKRQSFEHEHEARALVWKPADGERIPLDPEKRPKGIQIAVDMGRLVTGVVVSPTAPHWLAPVIERTVKRFGYGFPVTSSDLYRVNYL